MKHYRIQPTASKPNAMETYRIHIHYVVASRGSAIAIYTEKLRGCAIADHGDDIGRNVFSGHASGQFANARLYGKKSRGAHLQIARRQAKAILIDEQKKSWFSNLIEILRNPAHCIQTKYNQSYHGHCRANADGYPCTVTALMETIYPLCCNETLHNPAHCIQAKCNQNLLHRYPLCCCISWVCNRNLYGETSGLCDCGARS